MPKLFIFLAVLLVGVSGIFLLFFSPLFKVDTIYLEGSPDVVNESDLAIRNSNLLLINTEVLENKLSTYPLVKEASVTKQFPRSLKIAITERLPAVSYRDQQTYFIDEAGNILPPLTRFLSSTYPELACELENVGAASNVSNTGLIAAIKLISLIKHEIPIVSLHCLSEENYLAKTDRSEIIFSSNQDQNQLSASLLFLFKQFRIEGKLPERVDMRFEKPVVVPLSKASLKPTDSREKRESDILTYAR